MRVVAFGTYDASAHPRAAVLLEGLRARGNDVTEINVRLGLGTAQRVALLQRPWRLPLLAARLGACWVRLVTASLGQKRPDVVLVPYLGHFDVLLARLRWPRSTIVLDHLVSAADTAFDRGERYGVKLRLLRSLDSRALRAADVVVVDTEENAARLVRGTRAPTVVVPVGATLSWFAAAERRDSARADTPLRVVFFGSFTPLQGSPTIARALARVDEGLLDVTMIGTGQDYAEVRRLLSHRRNVTWRDWVPIAELPDVVAGHDVCLGIFGETGKARSVVPTKIYQGAAAGCALVTSSTSPQRRALGERAVFVPPGDPEALGEALTSLAESPHRVRALQEAATEGARSFTPMQVVTSLADLLDRCRVGSRHLSGVDDSGASS